MTWEDFAALGFEIEYRGKLDPGLHGPRKHLDDLRFEIDSRLDLVGDGHDFATRSRSARYGACAVCSDPMPHYVAGICELCEFARAKKLRNRPTPERAA